MEAHGAAATTLLSIFTTVNYRMLLCLTATIDRLDGRGEILKQYAPVCDQITLTEATKEGWVAPVKNYLVLLDVDLQPYKELDRKFNSYFAFFGFQFDTAMNCLQNWRFRNKYAKEIGSDPKTVLQMSSCWMKALHARKSFIENHPKKIEICRRIIDAKPNTKGILFCPTIKFAKEIKRGKVLYSAQKTSENKKIIEEFNVAEKGWIASSRMLNEGCNIDGLTTGIIMNVNSSKISSVQKTGRCCRFAPNKVAEIFTLAIKGTQEVKWFNNSSTTEYITINDSTDLDKVLNGEEINSRQREWTEDKTYRF